jgi:hypothetical protein
MFGRFCVRIVACGVTNLKKFSLVIFPFFLAYTGMLAFKERTSLSSSSSVLLTISLTLFDSRVMAVAIFHMPMNILLRNASTFTCNQLAWRSLKQICFFHTLVALLPALSIFVL